MSNNKHNYLLMKNLLEKITILSIGVYLGLFLRPLEITIQNAKNDQALDSMIILLDDIDNKLEKSYIYKKTNYYEREYNQQQRNGYGS